MKGLYRFKGEQGPKILVFLIAEGYHPHVAALDVEFDTEETPEQPRSKSPKPEQLKGVPTL